MTTVTAFGPPQRSLAYSRARDRGIALLLAQHPVTATLLVTLGWFPNRQKALRRLRRLAAKGHIRFVGTVQLKAGRPQHVFCRVRVKSDDLLHEIELTELCLRLDVAAIRRGPHMRDQQIRPDAELELNGHVIHVEWDRGTMKLSDIVQRFRRYEGSPHLVLWICPTAARRDAFRARAERLRAIALFTTSVEALTSPHEAIWVDVGGKRAALPRQKSGTDEAPATGGVS